MMTPEDVVKKIQEEDIKIVDVRFVDLLGTWQHFSVPAHTITEEVFEEGIGFDGSSIRGWKSINESDMLVIPDPSTAFVDPFTEVGTLNIICEIVDPVTREPYERHPREVAKKAEEFLKSTGIADTAYFGPELEFFILDDVKYKIESNIAYYEVDSAEGIWNTAREEDPNLGYKIRHKEGYFPVPPLDSLQDLRSEIVLELEKAGIEIEAQHHEVATAGQAEIDVRFTSLMQQADNVMKYKYIAKNVALMYGKTITFMPKPLSGDNGTGMHTHQSLWKDGKPLFAGNGYAGLSELALYYIGGIIKHGKALAAFTNPTTISYKRLVPGFEAPINLAYSSRNRSAAVRIPMYSPSPKAKRIEVRFPDPTANPYLAFAAMLMAGIDGIINKIDPGEPMDKNIYDLPPEELAKVDKMPRNLEEALEELEKDHEFLLRGDVFTEDLIRTWIDYKRENEIKFVNSIPHPAEFYLYFDV